MSDAHQNVLAGALIELLRPHSPAQATAALMAAAAHMFQHHGAKAATRKHFVGYAGQVWAQFTAFKKHGPKPKPDKAEHVLGAARYLRAALFSEIPEEPDTNHVIIGQHKVTQAINFYDGKVDEPPDTEIPR